MSVNNIPIFVGKINVSTTRIFDTTSIIDVSNPIPYPDAGYNLHKVFQANSTYGSFLQKLRFKIVGTTTFSVSYPANIIKVLLCNSSSLNSPRLFDEIFIPAMTVTTTSISPTLELLLNLNLGPQMSVWVGQTVDANASLDIISFGGDYEENI